jgi:iron complex transport system permease protein
VTGLTGCSLFGEPNSDGSSVLVGLLVGAAFGLSGAIFQRLARTPLASPDIIGVNVGAAASAVLAIVLLHGSSAQVAWGALAGAMAAATAIYLLSYKRGVTGYRLVLVGIGATAMLTSATSYLMPGPRSTTPSGRWCG